MRSKLKIISVLAGLALSLAVSAEPTQKVLSNGMKVIVEVDDRAPVVVHQVWYKVGSVSEHDGITGISHVLEHMMFKGTANYPEGEFSDIIARNGGRENAFTSKEYTGYYQQISADRLELMMQLEADRMRHLKLDEEEFRLEVQVVKEERRTRTDDRPRSLLFERFLATAWLSSPERLPVIGWPTDLDELTLDDLKRWYEQWYAPNNAVLVVVGDVSPDEVFRLAEKYYGVLEPFEFKPIKSRPEIAQNGARYIELEAPAKLPYIMMGYKVPSLGTLDDPKDAYALEVLAGVLDGGGSARFTRNLIRGQKIAAAAGVGYNMNKPGETLFLLDGTPLPETSIDDLKTALLTQVDKVKTEGVEESELNRVKAQVIAADVFEKDSMFSKALKLGSMEILGFGLETANQYLDGIKSVTAQDVQAVAKKYLINSRLTTGVLVPQSEQITQGDDQDV